MRNRLKIFAFCAVLLLLPVFLEANAQAMEGSTPVYYNPDGGTYYHLDPDCASVAKEWRDRFEEFPYDSLFKSHWYLLPCSACVDVATQFLWEGEKEFRDAVPVLEQQLKELGISHLQPCAWRITPEKDEIAVIFFEERVYEFLLVLSDGEWVPNTERGLSPS